MINSRDLKDLLPDVAFQVRAFIAQCDNKGVQLLVTSTYRDAESQAKLYAQGRTLPGSIITNAKPGESFHQYRVAFDCVPLIQGKPLWTVYDSNDKLLPEWEVLKEVAARVGLEWAGSWVHFKEYCHFQNAMGKSIQQWKESVNGTAS